MSFIPLNKHPESEHDIQKHIREVELENALKLYQSALKFHWHGAREKAAAAYETLLTSDVLQDVLRKGPSDAVQEGSGSQVAPGSRQSSVSLLPYLIFKNHASLMLEGIKLEGRGGDRDEQVETLKQILLEYSTALSYDANDRLLWRRVLTLAESLGLQRLARFALEIEISEASRQTLQSSSGLLWEEGSLNSTVVYRARLRSLLLDLNDLYNDQSLDLPKSANIRDAMQDFSDLDWLSELRISLGHQPIASSAILSLPIRPASCSWYALVRAMLEKHRVSSHSDQYLPLFFSIDIPEFGSLADSEEDEELAVSTLDDTEHSEPKSSAAALNDDNPEVIMKDGEVLGQASMPVSRKNEVQVEYKGSESPSQASQAFRESQSPSAMKDIELERVTYSKDPESDNDNVGTEAHSTLHSNQKSMQSAAVDGEVDSPFVPSEAEDGGNEEFANAVDLEDWMSVRSRTSIDHGAFGTSDAEDSEAGSQQPTSGDNARKRTYQQSHSLDEDSTTRASKRVKQRATFSLGTNSDPFKKTLIDLFSPFGIDVNRLLSQSSESFDAYDVDHERSGMYGDFQLLLYKDWHDDKIESANHIPPQMTSTTNVSRIMALDYPPLKYPKKDLQCDVADLKFLADKVNSEASYFRVVVLHLLEALICSNTTRTRSPYLKSTWSLTMRSMVLELIRREESLLLHRITEAAHSSNSLDDVLKLLSWSQAILELLLDELVNVEKNHLMSASAGTSDQTTHDRVKRWSLVTQLLLEQFPTGYHFEELQNYRYDWARTIVAQCAGMPVDDILLALKQLSARMALNAVPVKLWLPNCQSLQMIELDALDLEISKFSTLDFFDAVFESSKQSDHEAVINYLHPVLLEISQSTNRQSEILEQYLGRSPLDFRLKLWEMLAKACFDQDRQADAIVCHIRTIRTSLAMLESDKVQNNPLNLRQIEIIRTLNYLSTHMKETFAILRLNYSVLSQWSLERGIEAMHICFEYLALIQVFIHYEDAVAEGNVTCWKSFHYFKFRDRSRQDVLRCWMIIYHIFKHCMQSTRDSEEAGHSLAVLINLLHDELGSREYCHLLDGALLSLFENEIFALDRVETENDLVQILHCRYGLSYQIGSFIPWEHYTKATEITETEALRVLPFVLTFIQERSPGVWLPRADLRMTLERLHQILWPILARMQSVLRNTSILERYIQHDIVPKELISSLRGALILAYTTPQRPNSIEDKYWVALTSLSLVLGRCHLSMFQSRNKNSHKGTADLEEARKYFQYDLAVSPHRSEAWAALGLINGAHTDIEFGYDAQRIWDRRDMNSQLQRETILCFMMAASISVREQHQAEVADHKANSLGNLLFDLGHHLYNASREPLSMKCFERHDAKYIEQGDGKPEVTTLPSVTLDMALKTAGRCLYTATSDCTELWRCHLLLGKVHEKLKLDPKIVLDDYVFALQTAPEMSLIEQGPLIDPHHRMISSVYKFLARDIIDPETAVNYLRFSSFSKKAITDGIHSKAVVLNIIRDSLSNICTADKRHWHHRPVHRMAVLVQKHNPDPDSDPKVAVVAARTVLENLFTAKGSGGNLLSLWRPEFERPGRHYYYANQYTRYYINLLFSEGDLELIRSFMKRIRKANQNVLYHREIWQELCEGYINLVKQRENIIELDSSLIIDQVDLPAFNAVAKRISEASQSEDKFNPPALRVLRDFYELRRSNGGLYDSGKIDDELINCYLILYRDVQTMSNAQLGLADIITEPEGPQTSLVENSATITGPDSVIIPSTELEFVESQEATILSAPALPSEAPVPPPKRGRAKEAKILKVGRRDILSRAFGLVKFKTSAEIGTKTDTPRVSRRGTIAGAVPDNADTTETTDQGRNLELSAAVPEAHSLETGFIPSDVSVQHDSIILDKKKPEISESLMNNRITPVELSNRQDEVEIEEAPQGLVDIMNKDAGVTDAKDVVTTDLT